jgi:TM2 domain-containing membrane protein YozV
MYKIIGADGSQYGPVNADTIRRWIAENRVNAQTLALAEGATEWKPLSAFAEFANDLGPAIPPPVPPQGQPHTSIAAKASKKIPAGICGILLGWLGIHKFILGYTGPGLIMLLVSLLGSIPTCGLAACVMWVIGLVEGILYLTKSDEEFVRTYVDGRKEWF